MLKVLSRLALSLFAVTKEQLTFKAWNH